MGFKKKGMKMYGHESSLKRYTAAHPKFQGEYPQGLKALFNNVSTLKI